MKEILYIDMDGVLVDLHSEIKKWKRENPCADGYYQEYPDDVPSMFRTPPPIDGAIEAVHKLYRSDRYDMFIASTAPWNNPYSLTDKRFWIERHFGTIFYKRITLTHRKDLLIGHYLIDDRKANGSDRFIGEHLHFGPGNPYPNWDSVLTKLL